MKYTKKDNCRTVTEVVERNTGMKISEFLNVNRSFYTKGFEEARKFILDAMADDRNIFIMGDYDVDGCCSCAIFDLFFKEKGYQNVTIRFPHRFNEGYGIREHVIDEVPLNGVLITVDNGIKGFGPVKKAKEHGIPVLIIDHHQPDTQDGKIIVPDADVIVDPYATGGCEFDHRCGAGLSFRLLEPLVTDCLAKTMNGLAALATIADVMPLIKDNRRIVKDGLALITNREYRTAGTEALLRAFQMDRFLTESDVGFYIAPAINAMSRITGSIRHAFDTLVFNGPTQEADELAKIMVKTNEERRSLVSSSLITAEELILTGKLDQNIPMCVYHPDFHVGIIGIIAGRLAEEYSRPVLVFAGDGDILKGSARSYGGTNLYNVLSYAGDIFEGWGGHAEAAGMSLRKENLESLSARLCEGFARLGMSAEGQDTNYDLEVDIKDINTLISEIDKYRPYGAGNPDIRLKVTGFEPVFNPKAGSSFIYMGNNKSHVKFYGSVIDAAGFDLACKFRELGFEPEKMVLFATADKNHFVSKFGDSLFVKDQLRITDFEAEKPEEPEITPFQLMLKQMAANRY